MSYEMGRSAVLAGGTVGMRLRLSPSRAWLSRTILLPLILTFKVFPRGARAPQEVRPPLAESAGLDQTSMTARLDRAATDLDELLRSADAARTPPLRFVHAYFGPLSPLDTLRMLSAHTRHHTRNFGRRHIP